MTSNVSNGYWPTGGWRTALPQTQGMDPEKLQQMFTAIDEQKLALHSVLVVRNGYIVAEVYYPPYDQNTRHELYSCTKSFISALVGIAAAEGRLETDESVLSCFPDHNFANTDARKSAMTIEHLLTMSSGLDWPEGDPIYRQMWVRRDWVQFVLDRPMTNEPGSQFNYNSGCSHVLSAIVAERTGMLTQSFAQERLFAPLGITNIQWDLDSQGLAIGGWGLEITPRDMAKFGYLYLNKGMWNGQQIVPAEWVRTSTTTHIKTGGTFDYGYQWWIYPQWDAYFARGRYGQLIFVIPEYQIVVVFTAGMNSDAPLIKLIEDYVVPAVQSAD
ncbi:MAG TPA: serine hydrolase [Anaerolineae bacterium]|nr:serine hydrolase [Anaerolineae bacterium]HQK12887.1 serine hydrolase [Anaerolineae bacterium]